MSNSKRNVVDPLDIVEDYGADTLRTYVLFMGDYGAATPWNENSVKGCKRFLERVAGFTDMLSEDKETEKLETPLHKTIKKVSSDIEDMKFNTAIAASPLDILYCPGMDNVSLPDTFPLTLQVIPSSSCKLICSICSAT